jgi:hypothetical protein
MCAHRIGGVLRAGWMEPAGGGQYRRENPTIQGYRKEENGREDTAARAGHSKCRFGFTISLYADQSARSCTLVEHPRRCQRVLDVTGYFPHACFNNRTACDQYNPEIRIIQFVRDGPGGFSKKPFCAVSSDRVPDLPAGHHSYAQAITIGIIMIKDNCVTAYDLSAAAVTNAELPAVLEGGQGVPPGRRWSAGAGLPWPGIRAGNRLDREAFAALLAAPLQNEPARFRPHPRAKAVNACAFLVLRLKCALHDL